MNSLVLLPFLAVLCAAAPGGIHYNAPASTVHAAPAPAPLTYAAAPFAYSAPPAVQYAAPVVAQVQVPLTKTIHYDVKNVVTGYTSQVIKPPTPALPIPNLPAPALAVIQPAPAVITGEIRQEISTPAPPPPPSPPQQPSPPQVPSTPCVVQVPGFPLPAGATACDSSNFPSFPQYPQQPPANPQPEPQPEGQQPQPPVESPDQRPPQDPEMPPGSQPGFPSFPGGFPSFPAFPGQIVQGVSVISEPQPVVAQPQPIVAPQPAPPAPVAPAVPVAQPQPEAISSDDTVLVENPEFRSAPAIPAAGPAFAQTYSAPAIQTYSAAIAPAPVNVYAAGPLVTKQQVLAPVRTHTQITPQVTQVQPEVHVRRVVQNVGVDQPVYHTPVVHKTHVAPQEIHHQTAYAAPAFVQPYAAVPAKAIVQKIHY